MNGSMKFKKSRESINNELHQIQLTALNRVKFNDLDEIREKTSLISGKIKAFFNIRENSSVNVRRGGI